MCRDGETTSPRRKWETTAECVVDVGVGFSTPMGRGKTRRRKVSRRFDVSDGEVQKVEQENDNSAQP
jgi:hypothetical protein